MGIASKMIRKSNKMEAAKDIERQGAYRAVFACAILTLIYHFGKLILKKNRIDNFVLITNEYMVKAGSDTLTENERTLYNNVCKSIVFQ